MNLVLELAKELNLKEQYIECVLNLLKEGATIPFIARYRKEVTGAMDEEQIREVEKRYSYLEGLNKRKDDVIRLIEEKDMMSEDLKAQILACNKLTEVEDLYRPFKEKKKTKASEAIKMGLEPFAKKMMAFPVTGSIEQLFNDAPCEFDKALEGTLYIIAEWISDNAYYRKYIRNFIFNKGVIKSKKKKDAVDVRQTFSMYYELEEKIKYAKHYRILAMNRGENEKILMISLDYDKDEIIDFLERKIIKKPESFVTEHIKYAIKDALKRLIIPSVEREIRSELSENADEKAIETFKDNLGNLLLTKPLKNKRVLGFDPAFRTGCKLAALDEFGEVLAIETIYPHEPKNELQKSELILKAIIQKFNINVVAIGNGTASRESESFVARSLKDTGVLYNIVSEAGASVYSASKLAIAEFPDLTVEKRSAISIGRRIQDPLSELVKIDPKSIGVGEYQHDVNQKNLGDALVFTVEKIVNDVGVNINTASESILKYVSGLNKKVITSILNHKAKQPFRNREDVKRLAGMSEKVYEQAIGFLRIPDSDNPLDKTKIHPESYRVVDQLMNLLNLELKNMESDDFKNKIKNLDYKELSTLLKTDEYTLKDIISELLNPGRDRRDSLEDVILKSDILDVKDLRVGMELSGTIRNVVSFGAFCDIGLHSDGLIHISKLSKEFVSNPNEIVKTGDIVTVYVETVDVEHEKVNLSLFKN